MRDLAAVAGVALALSCLTDPAVPYGVACLVWGALVMTAVWTSVGGDLMPEQPIVDWAYLEGVKERVAERRARVDREAATPGAGEMLRLVFEELPHSCDELEALIGALEESRREVLAWRQAVAESHSALGSRIAAWVEDRVTELLETTHAA